MSILRVERARSSLATDPLRVPARVLSDRYEDDQGHSNTRQERRMTHWAHTVLSLPLALEIVQPNNRITK